MSLRISGLLFAGLALTALTACDKLGIGQGSAETKDSGRVALAGGAASGAAAAAPDFGDDNGNFANDGECDDMRFAGPGMTSTPLLDGDVKHDASDCRTAFEQGRLTFRGDNVAAASASTADATRIQWGDDGSSFANDGECDDMRFAGAGMTSTPLREEDVKHDASDCRSAFQQGRLTLR